MEAETTNLFSSLSISKMLKRALSKGLKHKTMTSCQERSIPIALQKADMVVKAKTGTGKTMAFLVPSIERILSKPSSERQNNTSCLIISPTRDLAAQIEGEARTKVLPHLRGVSIQTVYGGTNVRRDLQKFKKLKYPDILVATPGRLLDHLMNSGLIRAMKGLEVVVFDEADILMDMGFRREIEHILQLLPPKTGRQNMLFSATFEDKIENVAKLALNSNFSHVDTVGDNTQSTHARVSQCAVLYPFEHHFAQLKNTLDMALQDEKAKVMVFFVTANLVKLHSDIFQKAGYHNVLEMHSRLSQNRRGIVSKKFRDGRRGRNNVMFTSDVSARGMDYPGVTTVIQVGAPSNKEQYIHRLGRTARAGKEGKGVLLLGDFESPFLNVLKGEPIASQKPQACGVDGSNENLNSAIDKIDSEVKAKTCLTWLGYYIGQGKMIKLSKHEIMKQVNVFATGALRMEKAPTFSPMILRKMGLSTVRKPNQKRQADRRGFKGSRSRLGKR
jgi:ATP-dependent RNA helicase MSS116